MTKFSQNNKHLILSGIVFLICYISLAIYSFRPPLVFDSYWHLKAGLDLLHDGISPWIDHYSFTFYGQEVSSMPVLFQTGLALFVSVFGEYNGFIVFKQTYVVLLLLVIYLYFKQIKASWFIIFLILPFLTYFIQMRLMIRPEIISNIFIVICLSLYLKARQSFGRKELLLISLLLLLWNNYHTPVFGYIIIFGLFLDRAIHKFISGDTSYSWAQWIAWACIIFLIGFINPEFDHFLISTLSFSGEWNRYIEEFKPSILFYSTNKIVYLSWALAVYLMIWSLVKKHYGLAFIAILLGYYSYSISRLVSPAAIINLCILAFYLSQISYNQFKAISSSRIFRFIILTIAISLPLLALHYTIRDTRFVLTTIDNNINKRYPVQVSDYLKNFHHGGNIFNNLTSGGYLIYKLSPDYKVHIDGRNNVLYPFEFYKHHRSAYTNSDLLNEEIEKYNINYVLYKTSPDKLPFFNSIKNLQLNFADEGFLLLSDNKEIAFPLASKLTVYPMCYSKQLFNRIKPEITLAEKLFSDKNYTIHAILTVIKHYESHSNKQDFFDTLPMEILTSDISRRFTAYLALHNHNYEYAFKYLSLIKDMKNYDLLMYAYSKGYSKDQENAEESLYTFLTLQKNTSRYGLNPFDLAVTMQILNKLKQNRKLEWFTENDIKSFKNELIRTNYNNGLPLATVIPNLDKCIKIF